MYEPPMTPAPRRFSITVARPTPGLTYTLTVAELVEALREFRRRYNEQWLIERHGYRTPSQARSDACRGIKPLDAREKCRRVG